MSVNADSIEVEYLCPDLPGETYHITGRTRSSDLFTCKLDYHDFLWMFRRICGFQLWRCYGYCLVPQAYVFVLAAGKANITSGIRELQSAYETRSYLSSGRRETLFDEHWKLAFVEQPRYLVEVLRDVLIFPVVAGLAGQPDQWPWSSYRSLIGPGQGHAQWLSSSPLADKFDHRSEHGRRSLLGFLNAGLHRPTIWMQLRYGLFLGDQEFANRIIGRLLDAAAACNKERYPDRQLPLAYYRYRYSDTDAIRLAYASGDYTLKQIAEYFNLHYSAVSQVLNSGGIRHDKDA